MIFTTKNNGVVLGVLCDHAHGNRLQYKNNKFYNE